MWLQLGISLLIYAIYVAENSAADIHCTAATPPEDCRACQYSNINISCPGIVVVDAITATFNAFGVRGCNYANTTCNATRAAQPQINQCSWQHSSCEITMYFSDVHNECDVFAQLSHGYVLFHCVQHTQVFNFGRPSQRIEINNINDVFYVLTPCHPNNYDACEYYDIGDTSVIEITNYVPGTAVRMNSSLSFASCEVEILGNEDVNLCPDLNMYGESNITQNSFSLQFIGQRAVHTGFLLQISVYESDGIYRLNGTTTQTTQQATSSHGTTTSVEKATDDGSNGNKKLSSIIIAVVVAGVVILLVLVLVSVVFLCSRKKTTYYISQNYELARGESFDGEVSGTTSNLHLVSNRGRSACENPTTDKDSITGTVFGASIPYTPPTPSEANLAPSFPRDEIPSSS